MSVKTPGVRNLEELEIKMQAKAEFLPLLEAAGLLPEETLPGREVRALEQRVLQNALHTAERLDHVRAVVVHCAKKERDEKTGK